MAAIGVNITALAWETLDSESPTRAEYQANWNALDTHNHDANGHGLAVRSVTSTAPSAAQHVTVTGDTFQWWGATAGAVKTALDTNSSQTLTNKTWNGVAVGAQYGGTGAATLTAHGVVLGNGTGVVNVTSAGTSGQVLMSNGASADPTFATETITRLGDTTLGSSATNITFSSIPGTYKHLRIVFSGRGDGAVTLDALKVQFNGDAAANYNFAYLTQVNAVVTGTNSAAASYVFGGYTAAASNSASIVGSCVIDIPDYASTTLFHSLTAVTGMADNASANNGNGSFSGVWRQTTAITSIKLFLNSSTNFVAGTRATLYGLN